MMSLENTLYQAFLHVYHQDHSNAAMHCSTVRYSPITFRLAEAIHDVSTDKPSRIVYPLVWAVLMDLGQYEEDPGR